MSGGKTRHIAMVSNIIPCQTVHLSFGLLVALIFRFLTFMNVY